MENGFIWPLSYFRKLSSCEFRSFALHTEFLRVMRFYFPWKPNSIRHQRGAVSAIERLNEFRECVDDPHDGGAVKVRPIHNVLDVMVSVQVGNETEKIM